MAEARTSAAKDAASNKPVESFRDGSVSAAIFTDEVTNKAGDTFTVYNVSLRRSYRVGSEWRDTKMSLPASDLLKAARALDQCHQFVVTAKSVATEDEKLDAAE